MYKYFLLSELTRAFHNVWILNLGMAQLLVIFLFLFKPINQKAHSDQYILGNVLHIQLHNMFDNVAAMLITNVIWLGCPLTLLERVFRIKGKGGDISRVPEISNISASYGDQTAIVAIIVSIVVSFLIPLLVIEAIRKNI